MSFGFIVEKVLVTFSAQEVSMVLEDETASEEAGEEQGSKSGEDLKEKYFSTALYPHHANSELAALNSILHLHQFPAGFTDKPYMPPEMI